MGGLMKAVPRFIARIFKMPKINLGTMNMPKVNTYPFSPRTEPRRPLVGKHLVGKSVKVVSHAGPEFIGRTGIVSSIGWNLVVVEFDDDKWDHCGLFPIQGLISYNSDKKIAGNDPLRAVV